MKFFSRGFTVVAGFVAMLASPARGSFPSDEPGAWTVAPSFTTRYVYRGVELAGACFQPWVDYTQGPLSLGIWSSVALQDRGGGDSDPEVDLYGAYTIRSATGAFSIIPGFYLYTYPDADKGSELYSATFEPSLAASFAVKGVQFTPKVYYDLMLKGATYEITAALAVPLTSLGTELDFSAAAGTFKWDEVAADASPSMKNWGDYWSVGVFVPVQVSIRSRVTVGLTYSEGRNNFFKQGSLPRFINERAHGKTAVTLIYAITL